MYQVLKDATLTTGSGPRSSGRANSTVVAAPASSATNKVEARSGLRHGWNVLRYILFGTGAYAPPIGRFHL